VAKLPTTPEFSPKALVSMARCGEFSIPTEHPVYGTGRTRNCDAPDLAMERVLLFQDMSDMEYAKLVEQHVAALNKALEGIPADRVRLQLVLGDRRVLRTFGNLQPSRTFVGFSTVCTIDRLWRRRATR
jgi:hypothetical protein